MPRVTESADLSRIEIALAAAIRPKSRGSSTIGMKKSVVEMTAVLSSICHTAASSPVSVPTSNWL